MANFRGVFRNLLHRAFMPVAVCVVALCVFSACEKATAESPKYDHFVKQTYERAFDAEVVKYALGNDPVIGTLLDEQPTKWITASAVTYRTTGPQGDPVVASGVFYLPKDTPLSEIKGVIVAEHGTILQNAEAPSLSMLQPEGVYAFGGYAVILPDLIGFGASRNLPHPYLHAASTAQVTADLVFAVREYVAELAGLPTHVVGYSQGGHSALAFQRLAETKYPELLPLTSVFAGAGPYDLTGTFADFVAKDYTSFPSSVPYIALGLDYGDDLGLDFADIFQGLLLAKYKTWYDKSYNSLTVDRFLGNKISDFMHPGMFLPAERTPDMDKLYASLERNSLLDWTPRTPLRLFHGTGDTVVPLLNSQNAYVAFKTKGCDVDLTTVAGDHADAVLPFYLYVFNELNK